MRRTGEEPCELEAGKPGSENVLDDLVTEIGGSDVPRVLTTADSLRATRLALLTQEAADTELLNLSLA